MVYICTSSSCNCVVVCYNCYYGIDLCPNPPCSWSNTNVIRPLHSRRQLLLIETYLPPTHKSFKIMDGNFLKTYQMLTKWTNKLRVNSSTRWNFKLQYKPIDHVMEVNIAYIKIKQNGQVFMNFDVFERFVGQKWGICEIFGLTIPKFRKNLQMSTWWSKIIDNLKIRLTRIQNFFESSRFS